MSAPSSRESSARHRAVIALVVAGVAMLISVGIAAAQVEGTATDDAVRLAVPAVLGGVYTEPGADADLSNLTTVVRGADAGDLAVYAAVYAERLAEPDGVARALLALVSENEASSTPVLVAVFAPDQFGQATRGIGRNTMSAALLDAQESTLSGSPTQATQDLVDSLTASEGRRWGRILLAIGVGALVLALALLGTASQWFRGTTRRARRRDALDRDAQQMSPRVIKVAEAASISESPAARAGFHDLSARYGRARERLQEKHLSDQALDEIERELVHVAAELDDVSRAAVPSPDTPPPPPNS